MVLLALNDDAANVRDDGLGRHGKISRIATEESRPSDAKRAKSTTKGLTLRRAPLMVDDDIITNAATGKNKNRP
jgi:hypothetical protein